MIGSPASPSSGPQRHLRRHDGQAQTAVRSGLGRDLAVLLTTDLNTLVDYQLIVPLSSADEDLSWTEDRFYPAHLTSGEGAGLPLGTAVLNQVPVVPRDSRGWPRCGSCASESGNV